MLLQNRLETTLHFRAGCDFLERVSDEVANDRFDERVIRIGFNYLHQLQRRLFQLDTLRRRFVKRAVDNVRPVDERADRLDVESETFVSDVGDKLRTRFPIRIEKLSA